MVCVRPATLNDVLGMQKCNLFWCASKQGCLHVVAGDRSYC